MNLIKVKWLGPDQAHPELGDLKHGEKYDVPEDLGKAWITQGVADPETAEAHKVARGGSRPAPKEKE